MVWYGGRLVTSGDLTMGELTAFLLYTGIVAVSIGSLASVYASFMRAAGSSQRIFELLDQKGSLEMGGGEPVGEVTGSLRFEGVDFSYPARPDVAVLRGFELAVVPGEVVALVGPSGAGKSTVASLVPRFYDPTRGRITLDGTDLKRFDPRSLRQKIGAVMQEPVLFAESIARTFAMGAPTPVTKRYAMRRAPPMRRASSRSSPKGTAPWWANEGCASPEARSSASPSPGRF